MSCGLAFAAVPQVLRPGRPAGWTIGRSSNPATSAPIAAGSCPIADRGPGNRPTVINRPTRPRWSRRSRRQEVRGGPGGVAVGVGAVVADEAVTEFRSLREGADGRHGDRDRLATSRSGGPVTSLRCRCGRSTPHRSSARQVTTGVCAERKEGRHGSRRAAGRRGGSPVLRATAKSCTTASFIAWC